MRKLVLTLIVACAAALTISTPAADAAGSCSDVVLFQPTLNSGVVTTWQANCNVTYDVKTVPQYLVPPNLGFFAATKNGAAVSHTDSQNAPNLLTRSSWTFQGLDQTPYCSFDWRAKVTITNHATGATLFSGFSSTLTHTC